MTVPQIDLRWDTGPILEMTDTDGRLTVRPLTPADCAALIKRLSGYLAAWHRPDVDLTDQDPNVDPAWHPPTVTDSDDRQSTKPTHIEEQP